MNLRNSILIFFVGCCLSGKAQYQIINNTLITSDKVEIVIGKYLRFSKPYQDKSYYSSIYTELALRSSPEDNLPKGISNSQYGKEVKVRKFYERKTDNGSKVYVIAGNGFINQAIDIELALSRGEVLVQRSAPENLNSSENPNSTAKNIPATTPFRLPWQKKTSTISFSDSVALKARANAKMDSLNLAKKQISPEILKDSLQSPKVIREEVSSPIPKPDPSLSSGNEMLAPPSKASSNLSLNPASINSNQETLSKGSENVPQPGNDAAHSVSSLLTLHPPAETKKEEKSAETNSKSNKDYDKFNKLKQLKELLDQGILNKEEFDAEKKKILLGG